MHKPAKTELLMFLIALIVLGTGIFYLGSSITSFVIKQSSYTKEPSLVVTSNGSYSFETENIGELKALKLDGKVTIYGKARVYLESNGIRYLVFDSTSLNQSEDQAAEPENLITAFAAKEGDKGKKEKNKKPEWVGENEFVVNGTTLINLSQKFADDDNDTLVYSASQAEFIDVSISNEIATINPVNQNFNTTITFTASDGVDSKSKTVSLIVVEATKTEETIANNAPRWVSDTESFVLNKTLSIDLLQYFTDEDNDTLSYSISDADGINESMDGSILGLSTTADNFNATITITASDGNLSSSKEIKLIIPSTIELPTITGKTITIRLDYKPGTIYDANDNGEESVNGVVDLTVENSLFSWGVDESKVCSRWGVYNVQDGKLTTFCNGNNDCCAFVGLLPSKSNWSETYYAAFNKDGAGYDNIVSGQVIYYDVNTSIESPKAEIYYSGWGNKSVKFFEEEVEFSGVCEETCNLFGLNKSSYTLVFEIEDDAVLWIDKIKYDLLADIVNNAPLFLQNISTINISKNKNATINLSQHFIDLDGDALTYDYYKIENITILFENDIATILPDKGFEGTRFTFITANDSDASAVSNVFMVNVIGAKPETEVKFFEIRNTLQRKLAVFDSLGNLKIRGGLTQNTVPVSGGNDFAVENQENGFNMVINLEGNMQLRESIYEEQSLLIPTPNSFIIQDKNAETVAYLNSTGSLFLKGKLTENVSFE